MSILPFFSFLLDMLKLKKPLSLRSFLGSFWEAATEGGEADWIEAEVGRNEGFDVDVAAGFRGSGGDTARVSLCRYFW